jgi:DnaK suppressor protein
MAKTKTKKATATKSKSGGAAAKSQRKPRRPAPKADPDANLSKEQVKELHDKLIAERKRVAMGLEKHLEEAVTDTEPLADEIDAASRHSEQAYLIRFADKERKLLREIDHALVKMRTADYGICEGTGEPIGLPRLSLRPWTRYSVTYKEELEREKRSRKF